jgi:hypothetical protein
MPEDMRPYHSSENEIIILLFTIEFDINRDFPDDFSR